MSDVRLVAKDSGVFAIIGNLEFATMNQLLGQEKVIFKDGKAVELDLAGVERANSAGLALLLEWQGIAQQQGREFRIRNAPDALLAIARISNCTEILNFV